MPKKKSSRKPASAGRAVGRAQAVMKMRDSIAAHGVALWYVFDAEPPFAYTVGMRAFDAPEMVVFSVTQQVAKWTLNNFAFRVRDGVQRFEAGQLVDGVLTDFPVYLLDVTDSSDHLTLSNQMYRTAGGSPVPALQVVVPDLSGRWPWEEGFDGTERFWVPRQSRPRCPHTASVLLHMIRRPRLWLTNRGDVDL